MEKIELIQKLNEILLEEMAQYQQSAEQFTRDISSQRQLLRSLMNVRTPMPLRNDYVALQDQLLSYEREEKGVVNVSSLPTTTDPHIILWRDDITRINAEAIVNAANSTLLGCFQPCHSCIDNAIHSAAGLQLREECSRIMKKQGYEEPTGQAKITAAYNLPSQYVIHICHSYCWPDHHRTFGTERLRTAGILLSVLSGSGRTKQGKVYCVLLHIYRRISFPGG